METTSQERNRTCRDALNVSQTPERELPIMSTRRETLLFRRDPPTIYNVKTLLGCTKAAVGRVWPGAAVWDPRGGTGGRPLLVTEPVGPALGLGGRQHARPQQQAETGRGTWARTAGRRRRGGGGLWGPQVLSVLGVPRHSSCLGRPTSSDVRRRGIFLYR